MLAIRILALWLGSRGVRTDIINGPIGFATLQQRPAATKPKHLLISMAPAE
jgi:hypothetical protein